jgi:hypothetical protein
MSRLKAALGVLFLCTVLLPADDDGVIHLKTRDRVPSAEPSPLLLSPHKRAHHRRSHLIMQFSQTPPPEQLQELEKRGVKVLRAAPDSAVVVSAADDVSLDGLDLRWVGRLEPEDKISPLIIDEGDFLIEFHPDVNMDDARALAAEHDLTVMERTSLLANHLLVHATVDQIWRLSEWDEVAYVFPASPDLVDGTPVMACDGAYTTSGMVAQYIARVGDGWDGAGLGSADLSYYFQSVTDKLDSDTVKSEIVRAFNVWAKYVKVSFQAGTSSTDDRTINVLFASGDHGDGYPFDGPGGALAHTFYPAPPNSESIAGDMHFDAAESWHQGQDIDLFSVALHETGHALGLAHSDQPGSVMYPYYRKATDLAKEDIDSIRLLYAAQGDSNTPTTPLSISIQSPSGSPVTTTSDSLTASGTVTGGSGTPQVAWTSDQGSSGTATGSTSWVAASIPLTVGNNVLTFTATDTTGARGAVSVFVLRKSGTTAVSLAITLPASSGVYASTTSTVSLTGTASHPSGIFRVTWANALGGSGTASGTTSWSTGSIPLSTGSNVITITAYEPGGTSTSKSLTVTYNPTAAAVSLAITSPASSGVYMSSASAVTLAGIASHPSGISRVTWANSLGGSCTATGTTSWSTGSIPLSTGSNLITVTAYEPGGTSTSKSLTVTYNPTTKDTVAPFLLIISPASTSVSTSAATITVRGSASDNVGVTGVSWVTSTGRSGTAAGTTAWIAANIPLLVGTNAITVRARDAAGNVGWRSVVVTRQ